MRTVIWRGGESFVENGVEEWQRELVDFHGRLVHQFWFADHRRYELLDASKLISLTADEHVPRDVHERAMKLVKTPLPERERLADGDPARRDRTLKEFEGNRLVLRDGRMRFLWNGPDWPVRFARDMLPVAHEVRMEPDELLDALDLLDGLDPEAERIHDEWTTAYIKHMGGYGRVDTNPLPQHD